MLVLSRAQVRKIDALAIARYGIPGVVLMENAGRSACGVILDQLHYDLELKPAQSRVAILCGGGNNGGDGYCVARHLHNAGCQVTLFTAVNPAKLNGDAAINHHIAKKMKLSIRKLITPAQRRAAARELSRAHILVDALLGTGFHGEVRAELAAVIEHCNQLHTRGKRVIAIDVPSGLDCETGAPSNAVIRADVTVTFVATKRGFLAETAHEYLGRVLVADIGAPPELIELVQAED